MAITQMYSHFLECLKGWPSPTALDYRAKLSANVTLSPVPAGVCVHLNSVGQFELGHQLWQMPLFLLQGSDAFDVNNSSSVESPWYSISPQGWQSALVATGGYELQTTEFDGTLTYACNDPLTSVLSNSGATGGSLTNASIGTIFGGSQKAVCGIVSSGKSTNALGKSVLSFWPVYFPGSL